MDRDNGESAMMEQTQIDIIREVINIGIGEAANSLSELVNTRVIIRVPEVHILSSADVSAYMQQQFGYLGVYISQDFRGELEGEAVLSYSRECSLSLLNLLYGGAKEVSSLASPDIATLQEIGNIIMVSCITTISNAIDGRITLSLHQVVVSVSEEHFRQLMDGLRRFEGCILIKNEMTIREEDISGYILVLLSLQQLQVITDKLRGNRMTTSKRSSQASDSREQL